MTTDTKALARWDVESQDGRDCLHLSREDGDYVLFTDHERVVGELDRLVRNVETENEFLSHALAESRTEVERIRGYEVSPLQAKNAELRAEIEALVKDAGRWRHARRILDIGVIDDCQRNAYRNNNYAAESESTKADKAIDAAMKEQAE